MTAGQFMPSGIHALQGAIHSELFAKDKPRKTAPPQTGMKLIENKLHGSTRIAQDGFAMLMPLLCAVTPHGRCALSAGSAASATLLRGRLLRSQIRRFSLRGGFSGCEGVKQAV